MKYQNYIVTATLKAARDFFKEARAVANDKLNWSPMEQGRSVINQAQEIAMCPKWAVDIVNSMGQANEGEMDFEAQQQMMAKWDSLDECERQFNARFADFQSLCGQVSDEQLSATKWLPYDGGRDFTVEEMLDYVRWNCIWHTGQVCYIQTLLGDKEMH